MFKQCCCINLLPTRWPVHVQSVQLIVILIVSVLVFNLMPTRWTCTSVCSISMTNRDSDSKCSSSVVVFSLIPTRWTCTSVLNY